MLKFTVQIMIFSLLAGIGFHLSCEFARGLAAADARVAPMPESLKRNG